MNIDLFTATGQKSKSIELPETLFTGDVNEALMHQAIVMQQSNRRNPVAHVKTRGDVVGSTKKLFQQKGTGRARRGPVRSPLMRGGGKAFGPRKEANFHKDMPKKMRHAAVRSCLSLQAEKGAVLALESYPDTVKTKEMIGLLAKLPFKSSRSVLIVHNSEHKGVMFSARNLKGVKVIDASYLNPRDLLISTAVLFLQDAIEKANVIFGLKEKEAHQEKRKSAKRSTTVDKEMAPAPKRGKQPSAKTTAAKAKKAASKKKS